MKTKRVCTICIPSSNQHGHVGTQKTELTIINESGLYASILKSRRPEAKAFRKWVTSEVLPAIRKRGSYAVPDNGPQPQFITGNLSHGADLAVAADRTFRGFLRSARSAGLRLPQALRVANRQTIARTGMDMLAELEIDASEAEPPPSGDNWRVGEFIRLWLDGRLPVPAIVCRSSDLFSAYQHWSAESGVAIPVRQAQFSAEARQHEPDLLFRVLHLSARPGDQSSARGVIPPGKQLEMPAGQIGISNTMMLAEFALALNRWLMHSTA